MSSARRPSRAAFTLIEVLIAIAIIGLLISISIPAIQAARESARRTSCMNNLRQFGVAFLGFESANKVYPASEVFKLTGPAATDPKLAIHDYMVDLLPYIEEKALYDRYDLEAVYCESQNKPVIAMPIPLAFCPSTPTDQRVQEAEFQPTTRYLKWRSLLMLGTSTEAPPANTSGSTRPPEFRQAFQTYGGLCDARYTTKYDGATSDYAVPVNVYWQLAESLGYKVRDHYEGVPSMFPNGRLDPGFYDKWWAAAKVPGVTMFAIQYRASQVTDGLSHTFMMTEVAGRPDHWEKDQKTNRAAPILGCWAEPYAASFGLRGVQEGGKTCLINCENADEIYSFHNGGANFLFADGHVDFVNDTIEPKVLVAMTTPDRDDNQK